MQAYGALWVIIWALLLGTGQPAFAQDQEKQLIDYEKLNLNIQLVALRSGNHDEKGQNNYYFKSSLWGLPLLKEEVKKPFAERKKTEKALGEFAQLQIANLKYWQGEKKPSPQFTQLISGETIRELVGLSMRTHKVPEDLIAILCRVEMYEREKIAGLIGEDKLIGEGKFYIIPEMLPHAPKIENQSIFMSDELGLRVELAVRYASLEGKK